MEDDEDTTMNERVTAINEYLLRRVIQNGGRDLAKPVDFEAVPLKEWLARPIPPREELLGPLVVRGERLVLGAATGEGKTTLVWWIIKALAEGGRFLDWKAPRPCRVLVLDAEQSVWDLHRLADETGLTQSLQVSIIMRPEGLNLVDDPAEQVGLEIALSEQWDVVVLDPLYKLHRGDQNDEAQAKLLMGFFDHWRTEKRFALIIPAHMRKRQSRAREQDFTIDEISGSASYLRGAEVVLGLKLIKDGLSHLHFFKSRSPGLPVRCFWPISFDRSMGYAITDSPAERAARDRSVVIQKVRTLLQEHANGLTLSEVMEMTGKGKTLITAVLKEIAAVSRPMPGNAKTKLWFLPDTQPDQQDLEILEEEDPDDE
jgi:hypothetical protein